MTLSLTVIGVSAGVLIALVSLFNAEESRQRRVVLSGVRDFLDRVVVWCTQKINYLFRHLGAGVFRVTFHFLLHTLLSASIAVLTKVREFLSHLQLRNKRVAKVMKTKVTETHLDALTSHKEAVSLTEKEKQKRRSH